MKLKLKELNNIIDYLHWIDIAFPQFLGHSTWNEPMELANLRAEWEPTNPYDSKAIKVFTNDRDFSDEEEYLGYVRKKYSGEPVYDDFLVEITFKFINAGMYYARYYHYDFVGMGGEKVVDKKSDSIIPTIPTISRGEIGSREERK